MRVIGSHDDRVHAEVGSEEQGVGDDVAEQCDGTAPIGEPRTRRLFAEGVRSIVLRRPAHPPALCGREVPIHERTGQDCDQQDETVRVNQLGRRSDDAIGVSPTRSRYHYALHGRQATTAKNADGPRCDGGTL